MSTDHTPGARMPVVVIDMQAERQFGDCPMCDEYRRLNHAVGWYCGPVKESPGEPVADWGGEIAGGMPVCKPCHDGFYALSETPHA